MLSKIDAEKVYTLVLDSHEKLANIIKSFINEFNDAQQFKILHSLSILLQNSILSYSSQIIVLNLLVSMFPGQTSSNPFYNLFLYLYESRYESPNEFSQNFISILENVINGTPVNLDDFTIDEIFNLRIDAEQPKIVTKSDLKPSILHVDTNSKEDGDTISYHDLIIILLTEVELQQTYSPPKIAEYPDILPFTIEEAQEFETFSLVTPCFLFDDIKQYGITLFKKSMDNKLSENESKELIKLLSQYPDIARSVDDKTLEFIVENNLNVAKQYIDVWSKKHIQIFDSIAELPITLSEIEIVKFCSKLPNMPQKFIDKWIANGMKTIDINNENNLMFEARMLCRLTSFILQQTSVQIGQAIKMDLKSFCLKLCSKGLAEAQELFEKL